MEVERAARQRLEQDVLESLARLAADQSAAVDLRDVKGVEDNSIDAAENLRAENVQAHRAERAADGAEKPGAVPGADLHARVAAVRLVVPGDDRFERLVVRGDLHVHEAMHQ